MEKWILSSVIFPVVAFMYVSLSRRINSKVSKDTCDLKSTHNHECYKRHEKILKEIFDKTSETNINVAKLMVKMDNK